MLPYVLQLANKGWEKACDENSGLQNGLYVVYGEIVYNEITEAFEP